MSRRSRHVVCGGEEMPVFVLCQTDTIHYGDVELTEEDIFRCKGVVIFVIDAQVRSGNTDSTRCTLPHIKHRPTRTCFHSSKSDVHSAQVDAMCWCWCCCLGQDKPYNAAVERLHEIASRAASINPGLHMEVFIHKVDGDQFGAQDRKIGTSYGGSWVTPSCMAGRG